MPAATPRSAAAALKWVKAKVGQSGWRRRCLELVRLTWGWQTSTGGLPTAYSGWTQTKKRHVRDYNPPAGAPCWFRGPTAAGHVCTATGAGDDVITNDHPTSDKICRSSIRAIERAWGCEYLGWTEDYPRRGDLPLGGKSPSKAYSVGDRVQVIAAIGLKARSAPGTESSTLLYRNGKLLTVAKGYTFTITKLTEEDGYLWATAKDYTYAIVDRNGDRTDTHFVKKV